jgi:hypothetical protein
VSKSLPDVRICDGMCVCIHIYLRHNTTLPDLRIRPESLVNGLSLSYYTGQPENQQQKATQSAASFDAGRRHRVGSATSIYMRSKKLLQLGG